MITTIRMAEINKPFTCVWVKVFEISLVIHQFWKPVVLGAVLRWLNEPLSLCDLKGNEPSKSSCCLFNFNIMWDFCTLRGCCITDERLMKSRANNWWFLQWYIYKVRILLWYMINRYRGQGIHVGVEMNLCNWVPACIFTPVTVTFNIYLSTHILAKI